MEPLYIKSVSGNLFALYHTPANPHDIKGHILFIPPFAEELNRSRHMISRQAREFSQAGYAVLILDLYGTGDSEGTYAEATVEIWQQDIQSALSWLKGKSELPITLWAMRTGALIAADFVQQYPDSCQNLILWSPVGNGKKFISQYLRIKLAAEFTGKPGDNQTTMKDLWTDLDNGKIIEIAGYDLTGKLAHGLASLDLATIKLPETIKVNWIETALSDPANLSPASQKIIEKWETKDIPVNAYAVKDKAFWTLQEPEWALDYITQTLKLLHE